MLSKPALQTGKVPETMNIGLDAWRAQDILEALYSLESQWTAIIQNSTDEDVAATTATTFAQLQILREGFEDAALKAFGPHVKEFSREPLVAAPNP